MAKEIVDTLIKNSRELITLRSTTKDPVTERMTNLGIIQKGGVAIDDGEIVAVDKTSRLEERFKAETLVDASGKVAMPGFVDPHTHIAFAGAREGEFEQRLQGLSYLEILAKGGGILETVSKTRKATVEDLVETAEKTLNIMLQHGTTTIEAKSGYGLTTKDEIKSLNAIGILKEIHPVDVVPTFMGAHAVPPEYRGRPDEYVEIVSDKMIPKVADKGLAEFCDVFCEEGAFNLMQSRKILQRGREYGLKPKVHADELTRSGGAKLAAEVGATSAEHLVHSADKGLKAMAKERVVAVLLPAASFSLMTREYANARNIHRLGVPLALGTDFNPSCWTENMQIAIALACREMHLTPSEAIIAATINAAHAIGRAEEVGSLEKGKKADIIIMNIPSYRFLGYRFGTNLVEKVIKEGKLEVEISMEDRT